MKTKLFIIALMFLVGCNIEPPKEYQHDVKIAVLYTDSTRDTIYYSKDHYLDDFIRHVYIKTQSRSFRGNHSVSLPQILSIGWGGHGDEIAYNVRAFMVLSYEVTLKSSN